MMKTKHKRSAQIGLHLFEVKTSSGAWLSSETFIVTSSLKSPFSITKKAKRLAGCRPIDSVEYIGKIDA